MSLKLKNTEYTHPSIATNARTAKANDGKVAEEKAGNSNANLDRQLEIARRLEMQQLGGLLNLEEKIRGCKTSEEITILAANETRNLSGARQVFVWNWGRRNTLVLSAISSLDKVDQTSPFVQWLTKGIQEFSIEKDIHEIAQFNIADFSKDEDLEVKTYPFGFMTWVPLVDDSGNSLGGIMLAKESEWDGANQSRLLHIGRAISFALSRFSKTGMRQRSPVVSKLVASIVGALAGAAMFIPVTLTTLAPVSITPQDAFVVTAPIDGVVKEVMIEPNAAVKAGDLIIQLEDENLINDYEIAARELEEAETRLKSLTKTAFQDVQAKRDLLVVASQVKIKSAQLDHAKLILDRSKITANKAGVVVFADREEWVGRPVQTGEQIMKIADPGKVEFTIQVPVADAIVLNKNARVKYFMDSAPLDPKEGVVRHASFEASEQPGDVLAYTVTADIVDKKELETLRLGGQGTAQLYGDEVPLYLYLFRRPISALRQYIGF